MQQSERTYSSGYRFGFNGKEKDNEIEGEGDSYDFGERIYDARLGRFFSVDPEDDDSPELTPYCFAANSPILMIDIDGLSADPPWWLDALSTALDFVPGVGEIKNIIEAAVGYDLAGNELSPLERISMLIPGGAIASKAERFVVKHADDIIRAAKKVGEKLLSGKVGKVIKKVEDISERVISKIDRKELVSPKKRGASPHFKNGDGVDLHHKDGTMDGRLEEMKTEDHMKWHNENGHNKMSKIDRKKWNEQRKAYWNKQYKWHHKKQDALKYFKKVFKRKPKRQHYKF